nr:unnamed protein product [Spirometra erinaceieuropaei]
MLVAILEARAGGKQSVLANEVKYSLAAVTSGTGPKATKKTTVCSRQVQSDHSNPRKQALDRSEGVFQLTHAHASTTLLYRAVRQLKLAAQVRRRHIPPPGTLEQRLFREVTKPIYKVPKLSRAEKIILRMEERDRQNLENPYRNFLVRRAKTDFYDFAEDRIMLIYQPFYCHSWEWQPILNKLHHIGFSFRGFPVSVLREAAKNTKWQAFADHVLREPIVNKYLFGSHDPAACAKALAITSRTRFLTLIGGVIGHRIMTRDEVKTYANFGTSGGLEALHSQLVSTSSLPTSELSSKLMHHTSELVCILHQHASTKSAECDDSNGSDK